MSNIRIERVPIQEFGLWRIRADHLQLVFQQDPLDYGYYQDRWWVLEGTRDTNPDGSITVGVEGANGTTTLSAANGGLSAQELLDAIKYPWWRGSHIIPSMDAFSDWELMTFVGRDIDRQSFPYYAFNFSFSALPTANSSSVVASLLYYIGVDIAENMPSMFLTFTVGTQTLLGTSQDEELTLEWSFDTLLAGDGNDTIKGSDGIFTLEKLYGGRGDDVLVWSEGSHIYHGGQPELAYEEDGFDIIDYTGVGTVSIVAGDDSAPHLSATYLAYHSTGVDQLFSIDRMVWSTTDDIVQIGEGVQFDNYRIDLQLDEQAPQTRGDTLDFTTQRLGLLAAPSDRPETVLIGSQAPDGNFADGGLWSTSLEWLAGSAGDDRIYAGPSLIGVEGGAGNDVLSGRQASALTGASPLGFDIELSGGEGNDTIVSGSGRSYAVGGAGADVFVLSALSDENRTVEFVINGADNDDRLYVPFNFLVPQGGDFEGSMLFPILGAMSPVIGGATFETLPQNPGPGPLGGYDEPGFFYLAGQVGLDGSWSGSWDGVVNITDQILFNRDGDDLLIHVWGAAELFGQAFFTLGAQDFVFQEVDADPAKESVIRIVDFQEGMLGIHFYELGEETPFPHPGGPGEPDPAKLWSTATFTERGNPLLRDALQAEPETPVYDLPAEGDTDTRELISGTGGDDDLIAAAAGHTANGFSSGADLSGGAGNDELTGSAGRDTLDGGTGDDTMAGGRGDDRYFVDSTGDSVIEAANSGIDTVLASLSYALPENVEYLTLIDDAISGQGNAAKNRLIGNGLDNSLMGHGGDDTLVGGKGDDVLDGGSGDDLYVYTAGDGIDVIVNGGAEAGNDALRFIGVLPSSVQIFQSMTGADVILRLADGGRVILDDFFAGGSISAVAFEDSTEWDAAFIRSAAQTAGPLLNDAPIAGDDEGLFTHLTNFVIPAAELLANDWDTEGDLLTVVAAESRTAGVNVAISPEGNVVVAAPAGYTGAVALDYTVSDGRGGTTTAAVTLMIVPNGAPQLTGVPLADQAADAGTAWSYTIPLDTFSDPDGHSMIYTASLADGGDLPAWLTYDPDTRRFDGLPPSGFDGDVNIRITASDGIAEASATFVLSLTGAEPGLTLSGTRRADTLTGGAGDDIIAGFRGDDVLSGGDGDDVLDGGAGDDRLFGGLGDDLFIFEGRQGRDHFDGGESFDTIRGSDGDDMLFLDDGSADLISIEAIDFGAGFDVLRTGSEDDVIDLSGLAVSGLERIEGGGGHDRMTGGAGDDVLSGGAGQDVFVFAGSFGHDTIDDFQLTRGTRRDGDVIDVQAFDFASFDDVFALIEQVGADSVINFAEAGSSITLANLDKSLLQADDFLL